MSAITAIWHEPPATILQRGISDLVVGGVILVDGSAGNWGLKG